MVLEPMQQLIHDRVYEVCMIRDPDGIVIELLRLRKVFDKPFPN